MICIKRVALSRFEHHGSGESNRLNMGSPACTCPCFPNARCLMQGPRCFPGALMPAQQHSLIPGASTRSTPHPFTPCSWFDDARYQPPVPWSALGPLYHLSAPTPHFLFMITSILAGQPPNADCQLADLKYVFATSRCCERGAPLPNGKFQSTY